MNETRTGDRFAVWLATGLGIGMVGPAPGTVGGLWGLPLAWAICQLPSAAVQLVFLVVIGLAGVAICAAATRTLGGEEDPGAIVLDEIVALPIVFLGVGTTGFAVWLAGWLLFRLFDIAKPWPIQRFEKLPGGWGVMADDWVAAALAGVSLHGLLWLDQLVGWEMFSVAA